MENHQRFLTHLRDSVDGVFFAAKWLHSFGYDVTVKPSTEARTHSEWKQHADGGDIFISQRIEVKKLGCTFSESQWPFGEDFIVCAKHSYDRAKPKPYAYLYVSADQGCVAVLKSDTRPSWKVNTRRDSRYQGIEQECYFAPIEMVRFHSMEKFDKCHP